MSRSGRGIILAAVGWLILGASISKAPENSVQPQKAEASQNIAQPSPQAAVAAESKEYTQPCQPGDDRRDSDLCAQWKAADAATESARLNWWQLAVGIGGGAGLLVALGIALHANWIARDAAKRELRAYVVLEQFQAERLRNPRGEMIGWRFTVHWTNAGQTPATAFVGDADWMLFHGELPDSFSYPPSDEGLLGTAVIGPHQGVATPAGNTLPPAAAEAIANGRQRLILWAAAEYTDAFRRSRRTELATEIRFVEQEDGAYDVKFDAFGPHNAIDDRCLTKPGRNRDA